MIRFRVHLLVALGWTLVALWVLWQYDLLNRKLDADASFVLYAAQQILRGHAPYVSVAIVKLPLAPLVTAFSMSAGRVLQMDDIVSGRIGSWICASLTVGAVYWIGARLLKSSKSATPFVAKDSSKVWEIVFGSLSAAVLVSSQALGVQVGEGPEAKLPMICAGMFCIVFLASRRFFWAGVAGALSFLAWQPGLLFAGAVVICSWVVPQRKRAFLFTLAGIAAPLFLVGAYLALNSALGSMFRQAFGANANYFQEKKVAVGILGIILANIAKVWEVSLECSNTEIPLIGLGYVGLIAGSAFLVGRFLVRVRDQSGVRAALRGEESVSSFLVAFPVLFSGAGLYAFSLLDLQKCSDLIPLLPFLALGAGAVLFAVVVSAARLMARATQYSEMSVAWALGVLVLLLVVAYGTNDAFHQPLQMGLAQQRSIALHIDARLQPEDRVQQFGDAVFLVVTRRENATRFVHLGEKQGLGILTAEGVTMDALVEQLRGARPRVITLSRAKTKEWAQPLYDWIETNYVLQTSYSGPSGGTAQETDVYERK